MARDDPLTPQQEAQRDALRERAVYLGKLLHPKNLAALRAEQGQNYQDLMEFRDGSLGDAHEELAQLVGLKSGKAIAWSISKISTNREAAGEWVPVSRPEDLAQLGQGSPEASNNGDR